jgi:hypothetical protein
MTDHPRFERVRGEPDVAHAAYHGGALVSLVFRLADRWMGRRQQSEAPAAAHAGDGIVIHERLPVPASAAAALPGRAEAAATERALYQIAPDENFSGNLLIGSARTMKVQAGLLAGFVGVMLVLLAQGLPQPEQPFEQTAERRAVPSDGRVLVARP